MRKGKAPFPTSLAESLGDVNIPGEPQSLTCDGNSGSQLGSLEEVTLHAGDFDLLHKMKELDWMSSVLLPTPKQGEPSPGSLRSFKAEPGKGWAFQSPREKTT